MRTAIYMVRHAESPYNEGTERTRGLTPDGLLKSRRVTEILKHEGIEAIISSPYSRATLTLEGLASDLNLEMKTHEDLRERHFASESYLVRDSEFMESLRYSFEDFHYALPGGESNHACQQRAVAVLLQILREYNGSKVAIGTHGNVMALMMNHFDPAYGWDFVNQTSKPDIYRLIFEDMRLLEVTKLWNGDAQG